MTGIVVVSHSRALADAAVRLAAEMATGSQVRVEVAAGLDEHTLGTDATAIAAAIEAADDDGVVVLMDLGSAVLSAELALELVDPALRDRVRLSPAPLVEGLVLAVVAAGGGAGPDGVCREAEGALRAKQEQIGTEAHAASPVLWVGASGAVGRTGHDRVHDRQPARPARAPGRTAGRTGTGVAGGAQPAQPHVRDRAGGGEPACWGCPPSAPSAGTASS